MVHQKMMLFMDDKGARSTPCPLSASFKRGEQILFENKPWTCMDQSSELNPSGEVLVTTYSFR